MNDDHPCQVCGASGARDYCPDCGSEQLPYEGPEQPEGKFEGFETCKVCGIRRTTVIEGGRVSKRFRYPAETQSLWTSVSGLNCKMMGEHEWDRMEVPS